jgi:hypothetical protein
MSPHNAEHRTLTVGPAPGREQRWVVSESGERLAVPEGWACLPPGDAAVTRLVKQLGPSWSVQYTRVRKRFSGGVWAPVDHIEQARQQVAAKRAEPGYARQSEQAKRRRSAKQEAYAQEFYYAVLDWLAFDIRYRPLASRLAKVVTDHAVPVGSGTVARTERIPIEERASAAVIAWMRHQTTAYDEMAIERVKGRRREVRRELATISQRVLERYRRGEEVDAAVCPLARALR